MDARNSQSSSVHGPLYLWRRPMKYKYWEISPCRDSEDGASTTKAFNLGREKFQWMTLCNSIGPIWKKSWENQKQLP